MKNLRNLVFILLLFSWNTEIFSQNCGIVTSWDYTFVDEMDGTYTYTFTTCYQSISGGTKSIMYTIGCGGTDYIISDCLETPPSNQPEDCTVDVLNIACSPTPGPYMTWLGNTSNNGDCFNGTTCASGEFGPVPVLATEGLSLEAKQIGNNVVLNWSTLSETNNAGFDVERGDGINWTKLSFIAGSNNSNTANYYSYSDRLDEKEVYYRVAQMDFNGSVSYSNIVSVNLNHSAPSYISVYPNPASSNLYIENLFGTEVLQIYSMDGKLRQREIAQGFAHKMDVDNLEQGIYLLNIQSLENNKTIQFVIQ